jgi:uncharacterized membrane protein YdbT with pleckstrin-like domain
MVKREEGIKYLTSRIAYIPNYFLVLLALAFLLIFLQKFNFQFTLQPKNLNEAFPIIFLLGFLILISYLIEEPAIERLIRQYYVTDSEVVKMEGLIRKKRVAIPLQSIADLKVRKGVIGRIFNFGDVEIAGFKDKIVMKGMHRPDEIYRVIKEKISKKGTLKIEKA